LVGRTARRGAIEHHYTARVRPTITDEGWASLPRIVKRGAIASSLQQGLAEMLSAAEQGGFDRDDIHYSRTSAKLDAKAWREISRELAATLTRIDKIAGKAAERIADDPGAEVDDATMMLLHFGGPRTAEIPERTAPLEAHVFDS
jgi:hypothetical protein